MLLGPGGHHDHLHWLTARTKLRGEMCVAAAVLLVVRIKSSFIIMVSVRPDLNLTSPHRLPTIMHKGSKHHPALQTKYSLHTFHCY